MLETPRFLQGLYPFEGAGLDKPAPLKPQLTYKVPFDKRSQLVYFRAGNSSPEMIYLLLQRNNKPMRYFPIAAKGATHVSLAVVEDLHPETVLDIWVAAAEGVKGSVLLDIGLMEI